MLINKNEEIVKKVIKMNAKLIKQAGYNKKFVVDEMKKVIMDDSKLRKLKKYMNSIGSIKLALEKNNFDSFFNAVYENIKDTYYVYNAAEATKDLITNLSKEYQGEAKKLFRTNENNLYDIKKLNDAELALFRLFLVADLEEDGNFSRGNYTDRFILFIGIPMCASNKLTDIVQYVTETYLE